MCCVQPEGLSGMIEKRASVVSKNPEASHCPPLLSATRIARINCVEPRQIHRRFAARLAQIQVCGLVNSFRRGRFVAPTQFVLLVLFDLCFSFLTQSTMETRNRALNVSWPYLLPNQLAYSIAI